MIVVYIVFVFYMSAGLESVLLKSAGKYCVGDEVCMLDPHYCMYRSPLLLPR